VPGRGRSAGVAGALGTAVAASLVAAALAGAGADRLRALRGPVPTVLAIPDVIAVVVLAVGVAVAAWYAASGLAAAACALAAGAGRRWLRGERALRRYGAPVVRRLAAAGAGAALGGALALTAAGAATDLPDDLRWSAGAPTAPPTAPGPPVHPAPTARATAQTPVPGATAQAPAPGPTQSREPAHAGSVDPSGARRGGTATAAPVHVVAAGESLWTIAADSLVAAGNRSTPAAVAALWPRWYAANADVIGPDPDLIHPGHVLVPPPPPPAGGPA
jgi:hypothetical protein